MEEESETIRIYKALVNEFQDNGFTEKQAKYLINLLEKFIPIV